MAMAVARPLCPLPPPTTTQELHPPLHFPALERRIQHYSSLQMILLVGEGDFSFSNALATAFGNGRNIVATSLDSQEKVLSRYADAAAFTLSNLRRLGALLFHEVDASRMAAHSIICNLTFDCVVYNFPHAGFHGPENDKKMIKQHKQLVRLFFKNAAKLLKIGGEVHVSHKVSPPYCHWKLEKQAAKSGLVLKEACDFYQSHYPGYVNRRGDGSDSAGSFHLGRCKTFKFIINPAQWFSFNPWCQLSNLLIKRPGFFRRFPPGNRAALFPLSSPPTRGPLEGDHMEYNCIFGLPLDIPGAPGKPRTISAPHDQIGWSFSLPNGSSMKRRNEDEDGYGEQYSLEERRFSKRSCLGFHGGFIHKTAIAGSLSNSSSRRLLNHLSYPFMGSISGLR